MEEAGLPHGQPERVGVRVGDQSPTVPLEGTPSMSKTSYWSPSESPPASRQNQAEKQTPNVWPSVGTTGHV